MESWWLW